MATETKKKSKKLWVVHVDAPQGYSVGLFKTKKGAYDDVLVTIRNAAQDMALSIEDEPDLHKALTKLDGKAALEAWDERINVGGGDAVHDLYLWVKRQKVFS